MYPEGLPRRISAWDFRFPRQCRNPTPNPTPKLKSHAKSHAKTQIPRQIPRHFWDPTRNSIWHGIWHGILDPTPNFKAFRSKSHAEFGLAWDFKSHANFHVILTLSWLPFRTVVSFVFNISFMIFCFWGSGGSFKSIAFLLYMTIFVNVWGVFQSVVFVSYML